LLLDRSHRFLRQLTPRATIWRVIGVQGSFNSRPHRCLRGTITPIQCYSLAHPSLHSPSAASYTVPLHHYPPNSPVRTSTMENTDPFPLGTRLEILDFDLPLIGLGICPIEESPTRSCRSSLLRSNIKIWLRLRSSPGILLKCLRMSSTERLLLLLSITITTSTIVSTMT
jgi:hypothetical protein